MQDDIDMEPLHKLFIYRKKLVKPYIERLLKWMDGITYMMSALFILTLVYEHGFLISFEEIKMKLICFASSAATHPSVKLYFVFMRAAGTILIVTSSSEWTLRLIVDGVVTAITLWIPSASFTIFYTVH